MPEQQTFLSMITGSFSTPAAENSLALSIVSCAAIIATSVRTPTDLWIRRRHQ